MVLNAKLPFLAVALYLWQYGYIERAFMEDKKSKLIVVIDEKMHKELKMQALKRNMTLRLFCQRAFARALEEEKKYE